jgi:hypothetical protein
MGYVVPPEPAPRLNVDSRGMPRDYATYVWMLYRRHVDDRSPERQAFRHVEQGLFDNDSADSAATYRGSC